MAGNTSVDIAGMQAAQASFQNAVGQCATALNQISDQQSQLAAIWTGDAATAFGQALTGFVADLTTVYTNLKMMNESLESNTGVYNNTSETTTSAATGFKSGLPGF